MNFFAEADRDAVILVYQERGVDARCTNDLVAQARKQIVASTVEADKRSRGGYEMEKSVFLETYKDSPEILKKAKWFPARVKDESGRWKVEQHTKIYDDKVGVFRFEESHTEKVASHNVIDDMQFEFSEGHQQQVFEDHSSATFKASSSGQRLTATEAGMVGAVFGSNTQHGSQFDASPEETKSTKRKAKVEEEEEDSDEDDQRTPMEKSLRVGSVEASAKQKAGKVGGKGSSKAKAKAGAKVWKVGSGAEATNDKSDVSDGVTQQLLDAGAHTLKDFKERADVDDGVVEALASLVSRLQSKRSNLSKKSGRDKTGETLRSMDAVGTLKTQVSAILDVVKNSLASEKKGIRKTAQALQDKYGDLAAAGVTLDMLPNCVCACAHKAQAVLLCCDRKWKDVGPLVTLAAVRDCVPALEDEGEALQIQKVVVVASLLDFARSLFEGKEVIASAAAKLQQLCAQFSAHVAARSAILLQSVTIICNDSAHTNPEVVEVSTL